MNHLLAVEELQALHTLPGARVREVESMQQCAGGLVHPKTFMTKGGERPGDFPAKNKHSFVEMQSERDAMLLTAPGALTNVYIDLVLQRLTWAIPPHTRYFLYIRIYIGIFARESGREPGTGGGGGEMGENG